LQLPTVTVFSVFVVYRVPVADPWGSSAGSLLLMISWHLNLTPTVPWP